MIRVFIVDDQYIIREGVKTLLNRAKGIEIVGEARCGESALQKIGDIQPDLVLLDINLPGIDGLDVAEKISHKFPHIQTMILSSNEEESYVKKAVSVGAKGYLSKNVSSEELEWAIELVYQGYSVIKPEVSKHPPLISYSSYSKLEQAVASAPRFNEVNASGGLKERGTVDRQSSKSVRSSQDVPLPKLDRHELKTNLDGIEDLLAKNNLQKRYVKYNRRRPKSRLFNAKLARFKKTVTSFEFGLLSLIILFSLTFLTMIALSK